MVEADDCEQALKLNAGVAREWPREGAVLTRIEGAWGEAALRKARHLPHDLLWYSS